MSNVSICQNLNTKLLNFSNEMSDLKMNLSKSKLITAKALFDISDSCEEPEAIYQGIRECCILSTEHSQKAILYADAKHNLISKEKFKQLSRSHDNSKLQNEQQKVGISILEPDDIAVLNNEISGPSRLNYNNIRYNQYNFDKESVKKALDVAEKAYNNLLKYLND